MSGSRPGRGLEHLGAQLVERPQHLAVLGQLGLAPQAGLDVAPQVEARPRPGRRRCRAGRRRLSRRTRRRRLPADSVRGRRTPNLDRTGLLLSGHREQPLPQLAAGPVQPDLGRRLGDPQLRGDGLVGQVVDVAEHDDGAQRRRAARPGRPSSGRAARRPRPCPRGRTRGARRAWRRRRTARRGGPWCAADRWVDAQLAVIRYIQVEKRASPRKRLRPRKARR